MTLNVISQLYCSIASNVSYRSFLHTVYCVDIAVIRWVISLVVVVIAELDPISRPCCLLKTVACLVNRIHWLLKTAAWVKPWPLVQQDCYKTIVTSILTSIFIYIHIYIHHIVYFTCMFILFVFDILS